MRVTTLVLVALVVACSTKPNPEVCCETDNECAALGVTDVRECQTGVCVANKCESTGCDGNEDCDGATGFCVVNACVACDVDESCTDPLAPVCDPQSHECRRCSADSECASGACDVAAGSCVAENSILFVSPGGTALAACTRAEPCSLGHAFSLVDSARPYVEMTPGTYTSGAVLTARDAVVVADDATLRVSDSDGFLEARNGASLVVRGLKMQASAAGVSEGIRCFEMSSMDLSNLDVVGPGISSSTCSPVKVKASTFRDGGITFSDGGVQDAALFVDRSSFKGKGIAATGGAFVVTITNSLIVASPGEVAIATYRLVNGRPSVESRIAFNTIIGGQLQCNDPEAPARSRHFEGNILMNQEALLPVSTYCKYDYNLVLPDQGALGGAGNISGDPRFIDAASGDYHLQLGSPAIDAADPTAVDDHDLDNLPRPQGGRSDVGAYELQP